MRRGISLIGALSVLLTLLTLLTITPASATGATVRTDRGVVRGTVADDHRTFQGIPFAAPPVGALRWKAPQQAKAWSGVRDATKPGSACPQSPGEVPGGSKTEDCLYLNVTTPASSRRLRPVVVWLHGGGFSTGAGSSYDARRMATQGDVVVVTANYRLGVFGFLAHPGLPGAGTFGLQDQLAALHWVRRNAAAFGGDPANVTVAGESAGAMSICALLTTPAAGGAFDKAIMESGACLLRWTKNTWWPGLDEFRPYMSLRDANGFGTEAASTLHCDGPDPVGCLRTKSVDALMGLDLPFNAPAYGTALLPSDPAVALRAGRFRRIPMLAGGNRDEGNGFAAALETSQHLTEAGYQDLLRDSFGTDAARVAAHYPSSAYGSPAQAWGAMISARAWACPTLETSRLLGAGRRTYAFEFADRTAPSLGFPAPFPVGAVHASELPYLFDLGGRHLLTTAAQEHLSEQMIGYWTRFAAHGDPNGPGLPAWHPIRRAQRTPYVLSLESSPGRVDLGARHQCAFWQTVP